MKQKNHMQTKISGGRVIIYKTLYQDFSILFCCLLTITSQNEKKPKKPPPPPLPTPPPAIACQQRHRQILSAVSFLPLSSSPLEDHVPPAGSACCVPALATPPAHPASRPTGPKLNCKLLFHSALVLRLLSFILWIAYTLS